MKDFWNIFFQITAIGLLLGWLLKQLISYVRIHLAARRLKIRDRGMVESYMEDGRLRGWFHSFCHTRFRVGIDESGQSVHYCWRCELIVSSSTDPDPKGGKDIPTENGVSSDVKEAKVLPFHDKKAA